MSGKKEVVVLGGGSGGAYAARDLDKMGDVNVTLVDTKHVFELPPATPMLVAGTRNDGELDKLVDTCVVPHSKYLKNGRLVVARAAEVSADYHEVTLDNGDKLRADYLVVATGVAYANPWKLPADKDVADAKAYREHIVAERARLEGDDVKSVLVVGGGAVGVEVAAEVVASFPNKKVTLVSGTETLLSGAHKKLGKAAAKFFTKAENATLLLGERAEQQDDGAYVTSKTNTRIEADIVYMCVGVGRPNTGFLPADALDERGFVKVDAKTMRLAAGPGADHVVAIGDCCDIDQTKMSKNAGPQGEHAAKLIRALIDGKKKLPETPKEVPGFIVALGAGKAVADLGFMTIIGFGAAGSGMAAKIKASIPGMVAGKL